MLQNLTRHLFAWRKSGRMRRLPMNQTKDDRMREQQVPDDDDDRPEEPG